MSPARRHRERFAADAATVAIKPAPIAPAEEGGQAQAVTGDAEMTPARRRSLHAAGVAAAAIPTHDTEASATPRSADGVMGLRLTQDARRLHDIKGRTLKITTKRELLPAYAPYIDGLLTAAEEGKLPTGDVLPTIMLWRIDTGDYAGAMPLAELMLAHDLPMPAKYKRDVPTLLTEEIANAADLTQKAGESFDLAILEQVEQLTAGLDMHDEVRAKLEKAIGIELLARAEKAAPGSAEQLPAYTRAVEMLKRAQTHHDRVGVKDRIKRAEKTIETLAPPQDPQPAPPAN